MKQDRGILPMTQAAVMRSASNARFRLWLSCLQGRGLRRQERFVLAGRKSISEALQHFPTQCEALLLPQAPQSADTEPLRALAQAAQAAAVETLVLATALHRQLDYSGTHFALLTARTPPMPPMPPGANPEGLELALALQDPANMGAVLRSALAFGVQRVILLPGAAHPFHPKALRAAAQAPLALSFAAVDSWPDIVPAQGALFALDVGGEDFRQCAWPRNLRLVIGQEGSGLPPDLRARRLGIAMSQRVESLNAATATAIFLQQHWHHHSASMEQRNAA